MRREEDMSSDMVPGRQDMSWSWVELESYPQHEKWGVPKQKGTPKIAFNTKVN